MKVDPSMADFLAGRTFSNGYRFDLGNHGRGLRRQQRLLELSKGRRVLHVGCCDHVGLIREKIDQGLHLHHRLCEVAEHCVGIDTNRDGVAELHTFGFTKVFHPDEAPDAEYDLCLLADVIEHVGDVVTFLQSMRRFSFQRLVVATPNLFRLRNWLSRGELVNTDHRYWFSPYTLCKVLVDAGYRPTTVELCHADSTSVRGALYARLLDLAPKYRDGLIVIAER